MRKKIRGWLFLSQGIYLVMLSCGYLLLYFFFFPIYYNWIKDKQIANAYLDIQDLDLGNLDENDFSSFAIYENEGLTFSIANQDMVPVYTSKKPSEFYVNRNIATKLDAFSKTPDIIHRSTKLQEATKLRGIITQKGISYYIVIKDASLRDSGGNITAQFLLGTIGVLLLLSFFSIWRISKHFSRPIERLAFVAEKISSKDFSVHADENAEYEETVRLAKSLNLISEQFQQNLGQIEGNRKQFIQQNVQQERRDKLQKDFIANISHELKTPLAVISSQTEMIAYAGEDDREYYLSSIQEEIAKITNMVSGLLNMSTFDRQMENMIEKTLDMKEILEYIIMKYDGLIQKKMLHLDVFLEDQCLILGDREYIEQAVNNYMMNAFEHTEMGGHIRVTLRKQKTDIRVGVYNSGQPIPDKNVEQIWNGFFTTKKKNADAFSHAGLGLYIVQSVITMQNGECGVENLPEGVEFWFTLPQKE